MPTYERLDYGSPDGSQWGGASSDALAFYGLIPVDQYTAVGVASTYLSTFCSNALSSTFGLNNSAAITSLIHQVSSMSQAGRRLGLWA